jgi:hypothetical protein
MTQPRYRDDSAIERRDQARRRLWPVTASALAGGVTVTLVAAGLAYGYAPGRAATSAAASPSGSTGTSTSPQAQSTDPNSQFGDGGLQSTGQQPSFGGFGGYGHAVSGGS